MPDFENYNAGADVPDKRDISIEELGGFSLQPTSFDGLPNEVHLNSTPFFNQGNIGMCTVAGTSHSLFQEYKNDADKNGNPYVQPYDPHTVWNKAKLLGASDTRGWILQGALQLEKDEGYSVGYAQIIKTPLSICTALANGHPISTGSTYGNWSAIIQPPFIYKEQSNPAGHIFAIFGYDISKKLFIVKNSWGEEIGDHGYFYLPFDDVKKLFSCYIQLDPSDVPKMKSLKTARMEQYVTTARNNSIWNGEKPDAVASDMEIRKMLSRALKIDSKKSRAYWAMIIEEKVLRGKGVIGIWNEDHPSDYASDKEISIMYTRALLRNPSATNGMLTRYQVAGCVVRDFL